MAYHRIMIALILVIAVMLALVVLLMALPQIDTRSDLDRARDNLRESIQRMEALQ